MASPRMPSRVRRHAMFGLTLMALLSSACSSFSPKAEVQTKQVAIDLAFGVKVDPKVVPADEPLRPLEPPVIDLPPAIRPPPKTFVQPDLCPPPSALGPKYTSPTEIKSGSFYPADGTQPDENKANSPPDGTFLFRFSGNAAGGAYKEEFGYKTIDSIAREFLPGSNYEAFRYRVSNRFNGINMWFTVVPRTEAIDTAGGTADGLFLKRLEIPRFGADPANDTSLQFSPASAETTGGLRIFNFPIKPGDTVEDQAAEVAGKDEVAPGAFRQSGNTLTTRVRVGKTVSIPVCDQLASAWKISWEITSAGEYPFQIAGNFYMGTYIGGWPLKEDFVIFSEGDKVISGNYSSNMARLDPGDYL